MTAAKDYWLESIWGNDNPYANIDKSIIDMQTWGGEHIYLTHSIEELRPRVVVEIGVWKGGSVITMARRMKELNIDGVVIAVDTWLGAWEHWLNKDWKASLRLEDGYPSLYKTFAANIVDQGLQDYAVPLPLDSVNAATFLKVKGLVADLIHIDGGHDFQAVKSDLNM